MPVGLATRTAADGADIGGYLHVHESSDSLLLFFHGNGEIAMDYDALAGLYLRGGASFWVVDYRGYGQSTGTPSYSAMLLDAEAVLRDVSRLAKTVGRSFRAVFVMGRSLGSASALYLAATQQEELAGLVLDSPFAYVARLVKRLGGPALVSTETAGIVDNLDRMRQCRLPTLILHGTADRIIPVSEAEELYDVCPSQAKRLVTIPGAGHNDLLLRGYQTYLSELHDFLGKLTKSEL